MEITNNDIKILLSMTLFVVVISFVFPTLGFGSSNVNANEVPDFDMTQDTFEFADLDPNDPDNIPTSPDSGQIQYVHNENAQQDSRSLWLRRDIGDNGELDLGYNIVLLPDDSSVTRVNISENEATLGLFKYNGSGVQEVDNATISQGEFVRLTSDRYDIEFENLRYSNNNQTDFQMTLDYEVARESGGSSGSGGWLERIPVIGGAAQNIASGVGNALGYIASLFFRLSYNIVIVTINIMVILYNVVTFFTAFLTWLIGNYTGVINNSPSPFVTIFMVIPGILLSFVFSKLVIVIARSLPFV